MANAAAAVAGAAIYTNLAPESRSSFPVCDGLMVCPHGPSGEGAIDQGRRLTRGAAYRIWTEEMSGDREWPRRPFRAEGERGRRPAAANQTACINHPLSGLLTGSVRRASTFPRLSGHQRGGDALVLLRHHPVPLGELLRANGTGQSRIPKG